jgi:hypothetical protein
LLAAKPAELWTLPKRFMRFEPVDGAAAAVPAPAPTAPEPVAAR